MQRTESERLLQYNKQYIPGGIVSVNRGTIPEIAFDKGLGAKMWDVDGNEYIDYHAAFGPHFLGHNDPYVTAAVIRALHDSASLYGSGTTKMEGQLAELIHRHVPAAESVQLLNTGSEATYQALRLGRAITGRDHIIKMQGGYNGWHNDVSCNLMTPLEELGPRLSPGEYRFHSISAGIPWQHQALVHSVNFNDLASVRYVCERYSVAALIAEPILQNVGVIKPADGYLSGLRVLADEFGFLLIVDEVKTGFRHALGGYSASAGIQPDLVVFGKALANGYPIAALAGKHELMNRFVDPLPQRRVLLAGTYNGHPVPTVAAIATIERLLMNDGEVYRVTEALGAMMEKGLQEIFARLRVTASVARQGSAFCVYFMDHCPVDWHDLALHHDFKLDTEFRRALVNHGIYVFPLATKQWSISAAHRAEDIQKTLHLVEKALICTVEPKRESVTK
jgi:glutamate-1-semialdehyde 2,1-aminomutase